MTHLTRRGLLAGGAALAALAPATAYAQLTDAIARGFVDGTDFGMLSNPGGAGSDPAAFDQSDRMRQAVNAASALGLPLFLSGGTYAMRRVSLPPAITIFGVRGATNLVAVADGPILEGLGSSNVTLRDLGFDGSAGENQGLLDFEDCGNLDLDGLQLSGALSAGVFVRRSSGGLRNLVVRGFSEGIFALDCTGLEISGNRISSCANGGIRVWSSEDGDRQDGTLVAHNDISDIRFEGGGNGQNGNGINVYRSNGVRVIGNRLSGCAFSAIRLNTSKDTIVSANTCLDSGEVAIFSEFGFSGSVISGNVIDGAAQGISMTNFDSGGRLATCTGNVVRNIAPRSRSNPDTVPIGIFAEADAVIADNVVDSVPGVGIAAGWGPYLRNVVVSGNMVRDVEIGIGISVAEGAGKAVVTGNRVSEARRAGIAGMAWTDMASDDLARDAGRFANVIVTGNSVG